VGSSRPSALNRMAGSASFVVETPRSAGTAVMRQSMRESWLRSPGTRNALSSLLSYSQLNVSHTPSSYGGSSPRPGSSSAAPSSPMSMRGITSRPGTALRPASRMTPR
jgi:hypothetical protein